VGEAPDEPEDDEDDPDGAEEWEREARAEGSAAGEEGEHEEGQADGQVHGAVIRLHKHCAQRGPPQVARVDEARARAACSAPRCKGR
jgi:hypothetical protein